MLKPGQIVKCKFTDETMRIKRKLGESGRGIVYLVEGSRGEKALKWYLKETYGEEQKTRISKIIIKGRLKGEVGISFIWPLDLVTSNDSKSFGYLMNLIDTSKYANLDEVFAHLKPQPTLYVKCKISERLAGAYGRLHSMGLCYSRISAGNLMFDPQSGDVLICDNDNIFFGGQSKKLIYDTTEYMAPEIIRGIAGPSAQTDLHSLAVLLFHFWVWHHPLQGALQSHIKPGNLPARLQLYGENPVFIFDPSNTENGLPDDPEYNTPREYWKLCPEPAKDLFIKAFTRGLKNPAERVTEGEWQRMFSELADCIVTCPRDGAENIWYNGLNKLKCWNCGKKMDIPARLNVKTKFGNRRVMLTRDAKLLRRHIDPFIEQEARGEVIGETVQSPQNPSVWGLRNLMNESWYMIRTDGTRLEVPPHRAAIIDKNVVIEFPNGVTGLFEK